MYEENKVRLGPHQVTSISEIGRTELSDGVTILFAISLLCQFKLQVSWFYTFEAISQLEEQNVDPTPIAPGEWVKIYLDNQGHRRVKHFNPEEGGM